MQFASKDFVFNPADFRDAKFIDGAPYDGDALAEGEAILAIDRLALTANTISYGVAGRAKLIRYLDSFPTASPYARLPFWGFGEVVASAHPDLPVGERLYGFYPLSTYLKTNMADVKPHGCRDASPARDTIPAFYSEYARVAAEPGYNSDFDDYQSLLRPVISTSFLLNDYLESHDFYNSRNVIITSASSKTSFGFGHFLVNQHGERCRAIGLTSASNKAFVEKTGCYHSVLTYDEIDQLPLEASVVFDMAGNGDVRAAIHKRLGERIAYSGVVGATHWDKGALDDKDMPGARPVFWSGPDHVAVLTKRLGSGGKVLAHIQQQVMGLMLQSANWLEVSHFTSEEEILATYRAMLDGNIKAEQGIIFSAKDGFQ